MNPCTHVIGSSYQIIDGGCAQCWKQRAEKAESAAAEMRERIAFLACCCRSGEMLNEKDEASIKHALSTDCGKGWGHRETIMHEAEEIVKKQCAKFLEELPKQGWLSPYKAREERKEWVAVARLEAAVDVLEQIALHKIDTTDCADVTGTEEPIECVGEWAAQRIIDCMNAQESAEKKARALREACGVDQPWPIWDVLRRLIGSAQHLLNDHNCDHQGHEGVIICVTKAQEMARKIQEALSTVKDA